MKIVIENMSLYYQGNLNYIVIIVYPPTIIHERNFSLNKRKTWTFSAI